MSGYSSESSFMQLDLNAELKKIYNLSQKPEIAVVHTMHLSTELSFEIPGSQYVLNVERQLVQVVGHPETQERLKLSATNLTAVPDEDSGEINEKSEERIFLGEIQTDPNLPLKQKKIVEIGWENELARILELLPELMPGLGEIGGLTQDDIDREIENLQSPLTPAEDSNSQRSEVEFLIRKSTSKAILYSPHRVDRTRLKGIYTISQTNRGYPSVRKSKEYKIIKDEISAETNFFELTEEVLERLHIPHRDI